MLEKEAIELLKDLIEIYSPSGKEEAIASYIYDYIKSNIKPDYLLIDNVGNVIALVEGSEPSIMLSSHMDTVKGKLKVKVFDDQIIGRGACDAKSPLACFISTIKRLRDNKSFKKKLIFVATVEEETTCNGIKNLKYTLDKINSWPSYAIFGEPGGCNKITIVYNGRIQYNIIFRGNKLHSSTKITPNPIIEAMNFLNRSRKNILKNFPDIIFNPTVIECNGEVNVIPSYCKLVLDIRFPREYNIGDLIQAMNKNLNKTNSIIKIEDLIEPFEADLNNILVRSFIRTIKRLGLKVELLKKSGTGEINIFSKLKSIPMITYGPGDSKLSHTNKERIIIDDYLNSIAILENSLLELDKLLK